MVQRDEFIEGLKNQLQDSENAHQESLRIKDDKLMQQCQELDVRKKLIAQLNTQLIQATNQAVNHTTSNRSIISPSPPVSGTPRSNSGRLRTLRKTTSSPQFVMIGHPNGHHSEVSSTNGNKATAIPMNEQVRRYHSGSLSKPTVDGVRNTSKRQSTDYREQKLIVYDDHNGDVRVNKTSVLPPIASDTSGRQGSAKKRNSITATNSNNHKKSSIQSNDIGTVIVNPLAINNATWDKTIPPQTNSKSSS